MQRRYDCCVILLPSVVMNARMVALAVDYSDRGGRRSWGLFFDYRLFPLRREGITCSQLGFLILSTSREGVLAAALRT